MFIKSLLLLILIFIAVSCSQERLTVDGSLEPPAPGFFEKDETLLGIDSNKNGIRDDVERFINREYKTFNFRNGARQYALAAQKIMHDGLSQKQKLDYVQELALGLRCFIAFTRIIETKEFHRPLINTIFNTPERKKKYKNATKTLDGSFLRFFGTFEKRVEACNFQIENESKNRGVKLK